MQLVNAAGGAYVPSTEVSNLREQITTLTGQVNIANEKLQSYDPTWKEKAEKAQNELTAKQFDFALEKALSKSGARSAAAVLGLLDRNKLQLADDGEILGFDKQIEALKTGEGTAFLFQEPEQQKSTGMSHQNGTEGAPDKKEEANAALRAIFGKAGN